MLVVLDYSNTVLVVALGDYLYAKNCIYRYEITPCFGVVMSAALKMKHLSWRIIY